MTPTGDFQAEKAMFFALQILINNYLICLFVKRVAGGSVQLLREIVSLKQGRS